MLIPIVNHIENEGHLNKYMDLLASEIAQYDFLCPNGCPSYHAIKINLNIVEQDDKSKKVEIGLINNACCLEAIPVLRQRLKQNLKF